MLFDNLSPKTDFSSKIQLQLDILNKNVLYVTHECDKILKIVKILETNLNLQKQVDEYFGDKAEDMIQTDNEDK